ncbi:M48 family metallopeptidase [Massilia oculi]|uniref:M48 family metallopeptidase n=1 Tax=Massilia hydrophila TaxID=3044279 RepID=A0ABS7YBW7_9BURK|nr:M48 family metallopeptidase [Massilia oculi]MCA1857177.1 M48 family metallopeptidase [Massilia oculi]
MKYRPALPEHNDNISHEHPLKDFLLILGGLSLAVLVLVWALGLAVDLVVDKMSPATEARITELMALEPPGRGPAFAAHEAWLQSLADGMRACAGLDGPVQVRMRQSKDANAFVMPGATVIVHSGLLTHLRSENGMSFVLAHELSHLVHRDHLRALGRSLVIVAAATVLTGDGSWATGVLAPAEHLGQSYHSRERETAADMGALRILQCRYGHIGGATEFFTSLHRKDTEASALTHYLASHPSAQARIEALERAIRQSGLQAGPVRPLPSL